MLDSLQYLQCTNYFAVDIMHDLLEGVIQYELKLFFLYLHKNGYISMNMLSDRIQSFNYGHMECKNKPSHLKIEDNLNLGLNAV